MKSFTVKVNKHQMIAVTGFLGNMIDNPDVKIFKDGVSYPFRECMSSLARYFDKGMSDEQEIEMIFEGDEEKDK